MDRDNIIALASLFSIALAAFGAALGQGRALASAMDGMTRNPSGAKQVMPAMIIGLVLIESLVIYVLVICFMYFSKVR
jgi:F-type H+-transporting ATPase subunit c